VLTCIDVGFRAPFAVHVSGGMRGLKDGGMVDRVGLAAWRQRRRQQQHLSADAAGSSGSVLPPCLVHVIERSSPFSGSDDAEACGEEAVQVVRCPKSGVNFFDLGDFDRQFNIAKQRASSSLDTYLSITKGMQQQQHQQPTLSDEGQHLRDASQPQQRMVLPSSVVLPSARRSAAAAAAVAGGGANGRRMTSSSSPSKPSASV